MGWLEGLLTGYQKRHYDIEADKRREAEQSALREERVFNTLLNSKDQHVKMLAGAGLMSLSGPQRKKSGLSGWLGEMERSPQMAMLQRYQDEGGELEVESVPGQSGVPESSGALTTPPPPMNSAALPAEGTTTPGSPALAQPMPVPSGAGSAGGPPPSFSLAPGAAGRPTGVPPSIFGQGASQGVPAAAAGGSGQLFGGPGMVGADLTSRATAAPPRPPGAGAPPPPSLPPGMIQTGLTPPAAVRAQTTLSPPAPKTRTRLSIFPNQADLTAQREQAEVTGSIEGWQEIYRRNGDTDWQQKGIQAALSQKLGRGAAAPYQSVEIEYRDEMGNIQKTLGFADKTAGRYVDSQGNPINATNVVRALPASALGMGTYANRAMNLLNVTPLDVRNDPLLADQVNALAMQLQENAAYAAGTGAGRARFAAPLTPNQAQEAHLPVGVTGPQLTGQAVPTAQQADRRTSVGLMLGWMDEIERNLAVLPKAGDPGGLAPGATIAVQRNLPAYREAYAKLDASINQILAALSRAVQQNVGTQTELDAQRAKDTIAQTQGRLLNPLEGDTQESARARIAVTKDYLRGVLSSMPATPTPTAAPAATPGAGGATTTPAPVQTATPGAADPLKGTAAPPDVQRKGFFTVRGRRYLDGIDIGPVQPVRP